MCVVAACSDERSRLPENDGGVAIDAAHDVDGETPQLDSAAPEPDSAPPEPDAFVPESCDFDYDDTFVYAPPSPFYTPSPAPDVPESSRRIDEVAHMEPRPEHYWRISAAGRQHKDIGDIVMPGYSDTMPLFERAQEWTAAARCYETPIGVMLLNESEAYTLYRDIAELTTGVPFDTAVGVRTVVGLRGAYPGRLFHHGNPPNRFNDTLVLLWTDDQAQAHVREFPVNTDTGAYDFGWHSSSSLRPNRRYFYINGWHSDYNALHIDESGYLVWDDANKNGHWDSDRNGWLPPDSSDDHQRTGGGHNIHMGSLDAPLGTAAVNVWSAGCQVIPGMANWTEFITHAWTNAGDRVNYFLIDVRDIDHRVWSPCTPDGTHVCPYEIDTFPFVHSDDTAASTTREFDLYNCSSADESGPEVVYFLTVDHSGTLSVEVDDVDGDDIDVDVHLLDADDSNACLDRAHISFSISIGPGRYYIIADTYVEGGQELSGPYTLTVDFQ
jgi:hypothetical protein